MKVKLSSVLLLVAMLLVAGQNSLIAQDKKALKRLIAVDNLVAAKDMATKLVATEPKDPEAHYLDGQVKFKLEDYAGAQASFSKGIKAKSKFALNHAGLSRAYFALGKTEEAKASAEKALATNKAGDIDVILETSQAYIDGDMLKDSEKLLLNLQGKAPNDPRTYVALGNLYRAKKIDDLALPQYEKAIEKDPNFVEGYVRAGQIHLKRGEIDEGFKLLNKAIELDPKYAPAYTERAELFLKAANASGLSTPKGQSFLEQAKNDMDTYLGLLPGDLRAQLRSASFLYLSGDYDQAIEKLTIYEKDTTTRVMVRLLAYSYMETGQLEKSEEYFQRYFKMMEDKKDKIIGADYLNYAKLYEKKGDYEKAFYQYDLYLAKNPDDKTFYKDQAKKAHKAKDYAAEVRFMEKILNDKSEDKRKASDYYGLGVAAYTGKDYPKARECFKTATELADSSARLQPAFYLANTIYKMESDTTSGVESWASVPYYQEIYDGLKDKTELDKGEKLAVVTSSTVLAFYYFDPEKDLKDVKCDEAMPYVNKVLEIQPNNGSVAQLASYCEQLNASKGGK
ncbi:MAG: tetratricopeptide repeat protein [Bacteroidota bacterium]